MHSGFHRKLAAGPALAALALTSSGWALSGCVQATRHSNTMVFGTNTTFGIKVGTTTGEVPEVVVGYDRQEAVIMPLVANTQNATVGGGQSVLNPCNLTSPVTVSGGATYAVHPCSLVAVNGKAMDSYSVLASFGAEFDAGSGAQGGLAQYFATGLAAQLLALSGGASVVSTGVAATASALKSPDAAETIEGLYGQEAAFGLGLASATEYESFIAALGDRIDRTPDSSLVGKMTAFEAIARPASPIADSCTTKAACKANARQFYAIDYDFNTARFQSALAQWAD